MLSPVLFAVYVNDLLIYLIYLFNLLLALSNSGHGCYFNNMFVGCVMYADDLLLLSASLCDLQLMIDICCKELDKLDMKLNVKKSQLVRIGRSHHKVVHGVILNGELFDCVDEVQCLGWYILSAKSFKVSLHHMRVRFFQCFNTMYAKSNSFSEPVLQ